MPIFEYICGRCEQRFETLVRSNPEQVSCPNCASERVVKQMSVFSSLGSAKESAASGAGCACTPATCGCH
jgi:putative FmdB family regulatory protein